MRLCRIQWKGGPQSAFYDEQQVVPLKAAAEAYANQSGERLTVPDGDCLLACLPGGEAFEAVRKVGSWLEKNPAALPPGAAISTSNAEILVPIPRPNKIFLLAGNYADHIREGGGIAAERAETFPYVFMKPPSTTLTHSGRSIKLPAVSPDAIDWELELAVVIGRRVKNVTETE